MRRFPRQLSERFSGQNYASDLKPANLLTCLETSTYTVPTRTLFQTGFIARCGVVAKRWPRVPSCVRAGTLFSRIVLAWQNASARSLSKRAAHVFVSYLERRLKSRNPACARWALLPKPTTNGSFPGRVLVTRFCIV